MVNNETLTAETFKDAPVTWRFWSSLLFFCFVLLSLVYFGFRLFQHMMDSRVAPIASVVIRGEMPYTSENEIQQAIKHLQLGNFFLLDVNKVQQAVEQLPWVLSASVRKQWPDQLTVYVVDQTPVAIWNGELLLNPDGKTFKADSSRIVKSIPVFWGPEGSEGLALDNFHSLNKLLAFSHLEIVELVLTERFAWQLTLNDGVLLELGREERAERVQRFIDIYPQIQANAEPQKQVDYVDLRYDTGVAVGWKPIEDKRA